MAAVRVRKLDLAVEAARAQQSRVKNVGAVGGRDHLSKVAAAAVAIVVVMKGAQNRKREKKRSRGE